MVRLEKSANSSNAYEQSNVIEPCVSHCANILVRARIRAGAGEIIRSPNDRTIVRSSLSQIMEVPQGKE